MERLGCGEGDKDQRAFARISDAMGVAGGGESDHPLPEFAGSTAFLHPVLSFTL